MTFAEMMLLLIAAHFAADFPLQGEYLAKHKCPDAKRGPGDPPWWLAMSAHCLIHAGFVTLITGNALLGLFEFVFHGVIDDGKCQVSFGIVVDQALHVCLKVAWALFVIGGVV